MFARPVQRSIGGVVVAGLTWVLLAGSSAPAQDKKDKDTLDLDKIPMVVMDALKAKFPKATITKWTKGKEGDDVVYDIEFKQEGRKYEADIKENGVYVNYEREIAFKDLPKAVKKSLDKKHPKAKVLAVMEMIGVKGKDEKLEGYEITVTIDDHQVEITFAPDGKILEESGAKKDKK
jgi:hypothetical protein